jgi:chemotaxis protein MotC
VRRSGRLVGAAIICTFAIAGSGYGQTGQGEPFELVRSLQSLQDQIARGNTRAHANQRVLLGRIAEQFDAINPERWKEPKNARAAVLFALNGGNVRALQKVIENGKGVELDERLLKGVLAFGEGRTEDAAQLLGGIEARSLDISMAGHVAYVQGELKQQKEPAVALAHFDDARLLAPGTIIEEAALRRQIALLASAGDADRYEMLATQYLRRFPHSVYAGSFRQQFAVSIVIGTTVSEPGRLARLAVMLGGVGPAERLDVYLTIASEALIKGKIELAKFAAANAMQLTTDAGPEKERARLYEGAALIATDDFQRGVELLSAVERGKLGEAEAVLLDAALSIAGQVRRLPDAPEANSTPPADADTGGAKSQMLARAGKAIADVDAMLSEQGR